MIFRIFENFSDFFFQKHDEENHRNSTFRTDSDGQ